MNAAQRKHFDEATRHVLRLEHHKRLLAQGSALVVHELAAHHQTLRVLHTVVRPVLSQELQFGKNRFVVNNLQ